MKTNNGSTKLGGYFEETQYPSVLSLAFTPNSVAGALQWRGFNPAPIREKFTQLDIGCGDGIGLCLMAAAYPQADFVGVDAMPEHVETGRQFAQKHAINNVELVCQTFDEFLAKPATKIEHFDYITSQGVITWVSEQNRNLVYSIVDRFLSERGAFTVGYNTLPGWQDKMSLQQILLRFLGPQDDKSPKALAAQLELIEAFSTAGAKSVEAEIVTLLKKFVDELPHEYMLHEYLNKDWRPLWFGEVFSQLADRGLDFTSHADFSRLREDFCLRKVQRDTIKDIHDTLQRQTAMDIFQNTQFRIDIFSRQMPSVDVAEARSNVWLMAAKPLDDAVYSCLTSAGRLKFDNPAVRHILEQLEEGPQTFSEICHQSPNSDADTTNAAETLLVAKGVVTVAPPLAENPVPQLNEFLMQYAAENDQTYIGGMVSRHGVVSVNHDTLIAMNDPAQFDRYANRLSLTP